MTYFLGVDPGESGAYALIHETHVPIVLPFHSFKIAYELLKIDKVHLGFIEAVHIFPGSSAISSTTFMKNAGGWEALLNILSIKHLHKSPQTWQKAILGTIDKVPTKGLAKKDADRLKREHKKKIKAKSIEVANKYFGLSLSPTQDGEADALNMALYAMKYFKNQF